MKDRGTFSGLVTTWSQLGYCRESGRVPGGRGSGGTGIGLLSVLQSMGTLRTAISNTEFTQHRSIAKMLSTNKRRQRFRYFSFAAILVVSHCVRSDTTETIPFNVSDSDVKPLACRIHLINEKHEPLKVVGQAFWHDHFVCSGTAAVELEPGSYMWQIERGPEWSRASGTFVVKVGVPEVS